MKLAFALDFEALCSDEGPLRLNELFFTRYGAQAADAANAAGRTGADALLERARQCETFIAELFGLEADLARYRQREAGFALLQTIKYKFVKRKGILGSDPVSLASYDPAPAQQRWRALGIIDGLGRFDELAFAQCIQSWQSRGDAAPDLSLAAGYSAWASLSEAGQQQHHGLVLFNHARGVDPEALLHGLDDPAGIAGKRRVIRIQPELREARQGFALTDAGPAAAHGLDQARYCLVCHPAGTDSCSHGLRRKDGSPERNSLGVDLTGCPLGERISEFQSLRREGLPIAALAMIMRDNPMVAATGHRICNDCSRACIFQQQTPVDIPGGETRILEDVLALPWGVEIYSLLTRWNPLRPQARQLRRDSGRRILVVGLGPAGFTLAHHLLNQGHQVIAIDGQKIEPLDDALLNRPVASWTEFQEDLARRAPGGFGGVAEYGITVRWNKNYLKLIRLTLERRPRFRMMGGVRLGAQLKLDQAFAMGFDHIALALGAGKPRLWDLPGALPRGVRMASDFLMALQLGGLYRPASLSSLQLELPLAVIGAGLTAVDAATEALAWYAFQVERFARRHQQLLADPATAGYLDALPAAERERATRFITHGQAILGEKARTGSAQVAGTSPAGASRNEALRILDLLQSWGGVTLIYRKSLDQSPAWRLNHEELQKALAEGIWIRECNRVTGFRNDEAACIQALQLAEGPDSSSGPAQAQTSEWFPVRSVLLAVGTERNIFTDPGSGRTAAPDDTESHPGRRAELIKALSDEDFLVRSDPRVTRYGDMHPGYAGSVVKAMASAARGAELLDGLLDGRDARNGLTHLQPAPATDFGQFAATLAGQWEARLQVNNALSKGIFELSIQAPAAAQAFQPGQFFRLQDFEAAGAQATEPMAMTGARTDGQGALNTIILQSGTSTALASRWSPGRPLILMGPCGEPSEIPSGKKVLLVGGGLGNAVLFSIGQACRARGCDVTYVAGYRGAGDIFHRDALEAAANRILWCLEQAAAPLPGMRPQDRVLSGNVLQALRQLAQARDETLPALADMEHLLVIGSDGMMAALAQACRGEFASRLHPGLTALASVNAPMQCMMKGICGQCLQAVKDPLSGQVRHVFACEQQDQPLRDLDFGQLHARLQQNRVLETQHMAWLARGIDRS